MILLFSTDSDKENSFASNYFLILLKSVQKGSTGLQRVQTGSNRLRRAQTGSKGLKQAQTGSNRLIEICLNGD